MWTKIEGMRPLRQLEAIVLAAGAGSRFGGGKLAALFDGRRLIDRAVDAALAAPVRKVTVVVGPDPDLVAGRPVAVVRAGDHALGMAHSLRAGLQSLPADTDGAFVFLGDMPCVPHAILAPMAAAFVEGVEAVAPMHPRGRGHPVLLRRTLFGEIAALSGDRGARLILDRLGGQLALAPTDDDGVLLDIDRREDLP